MNKSLKKNDWCGETVWLAVSSDPIKVLLDFKDLSFPSIAHTSTGVSLLLHPTHPLPSTSLLWFLFLSPAYHYSFLACVSSLAHTHTVLTPLYRYISLLHPLSFTHQHSLSLHLSLLTPLFYCTQNTHTLSTSLHWSLFSCTQHTHIPTLVYSPLLDLLSGFLL